MIEKPSAGLDFDWSASDSAVSITLLPWHFQFSVSVFQFRFIKTTKHLSLAKLLVGVIEKRFSSNMDHAPTTIKSVDIREIP